jgi:aldose 1-epimerase
MGGMGTPYHPPAPRGRPLFPWAFAALLLCSLPMAASISKTEFGKTPDGATVDLYTLTNATGSVCKIMTYGAVVTELHVPDRAGRMADVVLGFDNLAQYVTESPCFGATVGRFANRIAKGKFSIDGQAYTLAINNGPNTLHGGLKGFDKVVWKAEGAEAADGPQVVLSHLSPDGNEGFPGNLNVKVTYTLTDSNDLRIDYEATTDKPTTVNLTNHSYFNLAGSGDVMNQVIQINASKYTPVDPGLIPTGVIADVAGGPLDFTQAKPIGRDMGRIVEKTNGYDHNFVIDGGGKSVVPAARAFDPSSGRTMEVLTDQPGVQLYTSNGFHGKLVGKYGEAYPLHAAFCLETQHYPDSINKPSFPTTILRPGQTFRSTTIYRFSAR